VGSVRGKGEGRFPVDDLIQEGGLFLVRERRVFFI